MAPRLKVKYDEEVAKSLMEQFEYANVMQVPKLEKIVCNIALKKPSPM